MLKTGAIAAVLIDRIVGVLGLFLLAGLAGLVNWPGAEAEMRGLIAVVWTTLCAGLLALATVVTPALIGPLDRLEVRPRRFRKLFSELHAVSLAYHGRKSSILVATSLSLFNQTLVCLAFASVSAAFLPHPGP
jgi:hypothetical protein